MSVVGIDLGSLSTVVAVARNKGIDVICNDVSNRATPSLVTFAKLQRFIGEGAKTMEISNFHDTVSSLIRLVGRDFNDPDITRESKFVNCALVDQDNQVAAQVSFKDQTHTFTYTQILAMFLNHVSKYTSAELKAPVNDCVISCPGWFTEKQRRAILDAAEISYL